MRIRHNPPSLSNTDRLRLGTKLDIVGCLEKHAKKWKEFYRDDDKKTELFLFLILKTASLETEKQIIITHHKDIPFTQPRSKTSLAPCT